MQTVGQPVPPDGPDDAGIVLPLLAEDVSAATVLPLLAEDVSIERRRVETARVRVQVSTTLRDHQVDEALTQERVEIERVPIGRVVDAAPPDRQEGDTTVISVVEEVVFVERRLVLREEVRIRRVPVAGRHQETVALRTQGVTVDRLPARTEAAGPATGGAATAQPATRDPNE